MPDDIVNPVTNDKPVNPVNPVNPVATDSWWLWQPKVGDMVACYGVDKKKTRFFIQQ